MAFAVAAPPVTTPVVLLPSSNRPTAVLFIGWHRPDHIFGPPDRTRPPTSPRYPCKSKVIEHCASVNGIKQRSGRPNGHIGRDAGCRARGSEAPLQGPVACKPFLRSVCIRIDRSRVYSKVWCLHKGTCHDSLQEGPLARSTD